ncbi:lema family protein [Variovorax sp. ZT4R33]|uniref:lema family protein n=1 Tax=Variovorax sp. ZT4R33 TaxID=3443743 RepID=UPI003F489D1F
MMDRLPPELPWWIAAALLLFWFVGAYNRLVRLRSSALQAYATLDAALSRQLDFVQARAQAADEAATGPEATAQLRATALQLTTLLGAARQRPLDPERMAALGTALHVMLAAWQRLYPDEVVSFEPDGTLSRPVPLGGVAADPPPAFAATAIAWPEPSAAAEIARGQFNQAVRQYNAAVRQFPALLVAWVMQLKRAAALD